MVHKGNDSMEEKTEDKAYQYQSNVLGFLSCTVP